METPMEILMLMDFGKVKPMEILMGLHLVKYLVKQKHWEIV